MFLEGEGPTLKAIKMALSDKSENPESLKKSRTSWEALRLMCR